MDRTQKRCLTGSVVLHGILLAVLVAGAAFAPKPDIFTGPVLEFLPPDLKLTDGDAAGGGNPDTKQPSASHSSTAPSSPPVNPVVREEPRPAKPVTPPKPEKRVETKPEKDGKPVQKPDKAAKAEADKKITESSAKAQDTDNARRTTRPVIQVAGQKSRRPANADGESRKERETAERREREAREEQETADRRNQAIEAANRARQDLASRLKSGADRISSGVGTSTVIEMPGPGGQAYGPYISYLGAFYRERWKNPRAASRARTYVGAAIDIAKDGTVLNWKLTEPSGLREVDDSVREVLKRYSKLRALPETTKDSQRTFTIQFRLDADTTL